MRKELGKYFITYKGKTKNMSQWAKAVGISQGALKLRLDYGWSLEDALTTPSRVYRSRKNTPKINHEMLKTYWSKR